MMAITSKKVSICLSVVFAILCWAALYRPNPKPAIQAKKAPLNPNLHQRSSPFTHDAHAAAHIYSRNVSLASGFAAAAAAAGDDHTCDAGRPCLNKACCGKNNVCGYGPDYCGDGCQSNCDAHSECGQYAEEPGKECPLNVCCSQFGFCGTAQEFCNDKCQSNCIFEPSPPTHEKGDVLKRVIGYYEGWNARSKCHETKPRDLPLAALTHVNFAFAFVDPDSFELVVMPDGKTRSTLFAETTALKSYNPNLKVLISVGGWTFSDDGTPTQPLLGRISRSILKRRVFAQKIVDFLQKYGFDGLDLDWEYPGAPDRGGMKEDTDNMKMLFYEIRQAFDKSGKDYELTFTIPASYWYLRWFDVPGLLKYADWANFMTYDIHGVWDRDNEIGNLVQPHTNITEIQAAAELLWRAKVPPSKIALGLGFYGRSFTLSDASCNTPGCRFSDVAKPGPCTATGGFLAYYEIQDILDKNPDIKVQHDEKAAVKYFSWDHDQWISFDDKETFKQKVDWANSVGMSGVLIWASDLDDYTFSAHSGLLGKKIPSNDHFDFGGSGDGIIKKTKGDGTPSFEVLTPQYDRDCYMMDECVNPDIVHCAAGYTMVGSAESCGGLPNAYPICCKTEIAPKKCTWRGGGADCNGQCHPGEATLFSSKWGGAPSGESSSSLGCNRGVKKFCCEDDRYADLTADCAWTDCGTRSDAACPDGSTPLAHSQNIEGKCGITTGYGQSYCCKGSKVPLSNCHWVGKGDCADNTCSNQDITLATDTQANVYMGVACNWGRKASLCCTPNLDMFAPASCDGSRCLHGDRCGMDEFGMVDDLDACDEETEYCDIDDDDVARTRRFQRNETDAWSELELDLESRSRLDERQAGGKHRRFRLSHSAAFVLEVIARLYPGSTTLHNLFGAGTRPNSYAYRRVGGACHSTEVEEISESVVSRADRLGRTGGGTGDGFDTEHNPDLQYVEQLLDAVSTNILPDGSASQTTGYTLQELGVLLQRVPAHTYPQLARGVRHFRRGIDYLMDQFGSNSNRRPLTLCERPLNQVKGRVFNQNTQVIDQDNFDDALHDAMNGGSAAGMLRPIADAIAVWRYINLPNVLALIQSNRRNIRTAADRISVEAPSISRLGAFVREFDNNWYHDAAETTREWVTARIDEITIAYHLAEHRGATIANARQVRAALLSLWNDLQYVLPPPDIP